MIECHSIIWTYIPPLQALSDPSQSIKFCSERLVKFFVFINLAPSIAPTLREQSLVPCPARPEGVADTALTSRSRARTSSYREHYDGRHLQ